uniref:Pancreatic trypsin inhibitor n=1 Tax=Rhipicephalus zambeziensis TaxID=60191 RepID=A0A224Y4H6_9ACAR
MRPCYRCLVLVILIQYVCGFPKWGLSSKKPPPYRPSFCVTPPFNRDCVPLTSYWYYESTGKACVPMAAGYCSKSFNTFVSQKKCSEMCDPRAKVILQQCLKPPIIAPCGVPQYSWYYDDSTKSCKMYTHYGCKSNGNSFASEMKCQSVCLPKMKPTPLCSADPVRDMCLVKRKHFFFSFKNNTCMPFLKKGCGKGVNSFASLQRCMDTCSYNQSTTQKPQNELPPKGKPALQIPAGPVSPITPVGPTMPLTPPIAQGPPTPAVPNGKPVLPNMRNPEGKPSLTPSGSPVSPVPPKQPSQPIPAGKPVPSSTQISQGQPGSQFSPTPGVHSAQGIPTATPVMPSVPVPQSIPSPTLRPGAPAPTTHPTSTGKPIPLSPGQLASPPLPGPPVPSMPPMQSGKPINTGQASPPGTPLHPGNGSGVGPAVQQFPPTKPTQTNQPKQLGTGSSSYPSSFVPTSRSNQPKRAALPLRAGFHRK